MTEFSLRTRNKTLKAAASDTFDLIIIGGGITGAGIALDAATRGLKTILFEKRDFASGTSSRSTKLIHGGLRYLEHMDFAMVHEGLLERGKLLKTAPHLAEPFPFVIPIYSDSKRNYTHPLMMRTGLILYDLFAGKYRFGKHRKLTKQEALEMAPKLDPQGLKGAFLYYDALTDDSRLVIDVIKAAHEHGAHFANYARIAGFLKNDSRQICGVRFRDELSGDILEARGHVVINATGVWMDDVINLNGNNSKNTKTVRPSKGVHLTVSADKLPVQSAFLIPASVGHRFYFVVPWEGRVNIGTTDTDYKDSKDHPHVDINEIDEILEAINAYFPEAELKHSDVISCWAGLRPLIADPNATKTTDVSRKEELFEAEDGLISISGGKLTTYRKMAENAVNLASKKLRQQFNVNAGKSQTSDIQISGGGIPRDEIHKKIEALVKVESLDKDIIKHLAFTYGSNVDKVIAISHESEILRCRLSSELPHIAAEIVYAVRSEMAITLSDALTRRMRMAMLAGRDAVTSARFTADIMASELNWDQDQIEQQIHLFTEEFNLEYSASNSF